MRFNFISKINRISLTWRVIILAALWLVVISFLHYSVNFERHDRHLVNMGYMPVITNLACPVLDYVSREGDGVRFNAIKFSSFAEMGEALRNRQIDVGFMISLLPIVLRQQGVDIKIIAIGNRHESTMVVQKVLNVDSLADLSSLDVAVPLRFSPHNLCLLELLHNEGLSGQLNIVEMNPPDMASALAVGSLDAYFVGEPFAAQTVISGEAEVLFYVEDKWPGFICNLVVARQEFIEKNPDLVQMIVTSAARSGFWARQHPHEAAQIAAQYWNQSVDLVEYALTTPPNRIVYDQYTPKETEMKRLADLMVQYKLLESNDISGLVDDQFAQKVNLDNITDVNSILKK